jgi:multicomponent K+:H+ antiporter subunit D
MTWRDHLVIVPVVLPLIAGAAMLLLDERHRALKATINIAAAAVLVLVALRLTLDVAGGGATTLVYRLGDWPSEFGIVLVADRLSAMMLLLTALLGLATGAYSLARWHAAGSHFHSLFQFQLMGINGAFLTGDLFNLFVFFELLLVASYGLVLHGSGRLRVRAGLHYVAVNLATSLLFLIGVSLIYGVTGTLNMADLAVRIPQVAAQDRALLEAGAAVLGIAFLVKAGMWPLGFWLPITYAAAAPPLAAMFSILSKVGIYIVLRLWLLLFGDGSGSSAQFGGDLLLAFGMATIVFGGVGVLASQDLARLASFSVLVSSGTVMMVVAVGNVAVTAPALFYLVSSTLAIAAFFMLVELIERGRDPAADVLAVTREAYGPDDEEELEPAEEVGVAIPAAMAMLGLCFMGCALVLAGLPPLSGFIAKFGILSALFGVEAARGALSPVAWAVLALLIVSGLATLIAMTRAGIRTLWFERSVPRVRVIEIAPVLVLLLACVAMTVGAGPTMAYMQDAAAAVHAPADYVRSVLRPATAGPDKGVPR